MYHIYGLFTFMTHVPRHHCKTIVFPAFMPEQVLKAIDEYQVQVLHAVPPMVLFMTRSSLVKKYRLSSLEQVICGGHYYLLTIDVSQAYCIRTTAAPLGTELTEACEKALNVKVVGGYGKDSIQITSSSSVLSWSVRTALGMTEASLKICAISMATY